MSSVLTLAWCWARLEIPRRRIAIGTLVIAAVTFCVDLATYGTGAVPVLSGAARADKELTVLFMGFSATLLARPRDIGIERDLLLQGLRLRSQRLARTAIAAGVSMIAWTLGQLVCLGALGIWAVTQGRALALTEPASASAIRWLILGITGVVFAVVVGAAVGSQAATRTNALAVVAVVCGAPLVLELFSTYPPLIVAKSIWPSAAWDAVIERFDGFRGTPTVRYGIPVMYVLAAFGVLARDPILRAHTERAAQSSRRDLLVVIATAGIAAACFGYVVPQRTAHAIPWWLRGQWVADLATGRTSDAAVRHYARAVLRSETANERHAILGTADYVLDPVLRARILAAGRLTSVRYAYDAAQPAGTTIAKFAGPKRSIEVTVCSRRSASGWKIRRVTSTGQC